MAKTDTRLPKAVLVLVAKVNRDPNQPRTYFNPEALAELEDSIRQHGLKNPIFVRPDPDHQDEYILVAGERRWRCCVDLQWETIPAFVESDGVDSLVWQIIENTQREDLNPIEKARGYARLRDERNLKQGQIAELVSRAQSYVSLRLALLNLPEDIQGYVARGQLSITHGNTLVRRCQSHAEMSAIVRELGSKYGGAAKISLAALSRYLDNRDRRKELQDRHQDADIVEYVIQRDQVRSIAAGSANLLGLLSGLVGEEGMPSLTQEEFRVRWMSFPQVERTRILSLLRSLAGRIGALVELLKYKDRREVGERRV